jgi:hypothetical protein
MARALRMPWWQYTMTMGGVSSEDADAEVTLLTMLVPAVDSVEEAVVVRATVGVAAEVAAVECIDRQPA